MDEEHDTCRAAGAATVLYRPVGALELARVRDSGFTRFPPRLPGQPIFYPVLTREYAEQMAREWNAKDPASGFAGYVTRFEVDSAFLARYTPRQVGGCLHLEYWIPAFDLAELNRHIRGRIEVIAEFRGGPGPGG